MSPQPPTKTAPPSPPKLAQPAGIRKKSKESKKTSPTSKTTTTATKAPTTTAPPDPILERPQSPAAESIRAWRILESLAEDHQVDQRTSFSENAKLLVELKQRQKQILWAMHRCMYLEKKYDVASEDRMCRLRRLKKGRGYTPTKAARIMMVKTGGWGVEEDDEDEEDEENEDDEENEEKEKKEEIEKKEEEKEEEWEYQMPGINGERLKSQ
ncbi:hypothetical protein BZA05DRAFT_418012 [Tricharina praecox]|uniref:uncharacterized protein n=1 Tax=Tricharina praecox TaxID=43433 RepID=UPI002220E031|nr:uncharacterized protein BZA05DRAFT_418012 [Tricharina praecox]KAI5853949.1 hypothetical protein BZA05DRAFT_418012 [Tricharina praecox]